MAPIVIESIDTTASSWSPLLLSIVITLMAAISLMLVVLTCCCGGKDDNREENEIFFSIDPNDPDYCEECARLAMEAYEQLNYGEQGAYPRDRWSRWRPFRRRSPRGRRRYFRSTRNARPSGRARYGAGRHRFEHGTTVAPNMPTSKPLSAGASNRRPTSSVLGRPTSSRRQGSTPRRTSSPRPPATSPPPAAGVPTEFKSAHATAYKTLVHAKSNVFEKGGGGGGMKATGAGQPIPSMVAGEEQMRAAQANPMYKTIWQAKSGVFDKPGGALGGIGREQKTMAREPGGPPPRSPQMTLGAGADDARMRAAAANPVYKTLWAAKSGVFDMKPGGGGGGAAPPPMSNYRE